MKIFVLSFWLLLVACCATAQEAPTSPSADSVMFRKIADEILQHATCYDNLRVLCKTIGHRISGSPAAAKAVVWGQNTMKATGADAVWLMPVDVPYWYRGKESLMLKYGKGKYAKVRALSLGNSEGTGGKVLEAPIVMVHDFGEFEKLPESVVKGKIVYFNYPFKQTYVNTFDAYSDAVKYRVSSPAVAARKGAVGVIIRSMSTGKDDFPHTGAMHYVDSVPKIPEMAIGNMTADSLEKYCAKGPVMAKMQSECHMMPAPVHSYNVIGEIKGSEHSESIITVGGHLDSWDVGEGANDDGTGCVQSMEVLRALKAIGYHPKCTIRAVLFMNEENGLKGGLAYADSTKAKGETPVIALETDAGGFTPRGIGLEMGDDKKDKIRAYRKLFLPYGVYDLETEEGGADISPLKKLGIPLAGLLPDSQRYFDLHHTDNDTFDKVNYRELELGAVALAQFIYLIDSHGL
jgi:carboxypeptidase Q